VTIPSGSQIEPYEVTALIGAGSLGEVHRATDTRLRPERQLTHVEPGRRVAAQDGISSGSASR
jgi:hypothetical protein